MTKRKIEMFQYRQTLVRLRQGDFDGEIAKARMMGRKKVAPTRQRRPSRSRHHQRLVLKVAGCEGVERPLVRKY